MLFNEDMLLGLDFRLELCIRRQTKTIFGCKKLFIAMEQRIAGDILIRIRAENDSQCRTIPLATLELIIHPHIHIHLPNILMRDLGRFEVNQHEALENVVIENEVNEIVFFLGMNVLLARDERISLPHLHQERTNIVENSRFQITFRVGRARLHAKEFGHNRI